MNTTMPALSFAEAIVAQFEAKLDQDFMVTPTAAIDRFTDNVLAGLEKKDQKPEVIEMPKQVERICPDCDGTGSVGRGGSYEVADQCCDTCRGRGVLPSQPADGEL